jgi:hypothetical protein
MFISMLGRAPALLRTALLALPAVVCLAANAGAQTAALQILSDAGDPVGQGIHRSFTDADGTFEVTRNWRNGVSVFFNGSSASWFVDFSAAGDTQLTWGSYLNARRSAYAWPGNRLEVSGGGYCFQATGRFVIQDIEYAPTGSGIVRFAADFEQHCNDGVPALVGAIRYNSAAGGPAPFGGAYPAFELRITPSDHGRVTSSSIDCGAGASACLLPLGAAANVTLTAVPEPGHLFTGWSGSCTGAATTTVFVNSVRSCAASFEPAIPTSPRTLLYWDSEPGHLVGQGMKTILSPLNSTWTLFSDSRSLSFQISDNGGPRQLMFASPTPLVVGVFDSARLDGPFNQISVSGPNNWCTSTGRFEIHELIVVNGVVERLALDFEHHCGDATPALFGSIRYNSLYTEMLPFAGGYPLYRLTLTPDAGGVVTGAGVSCGAGASQCVLSMSSAAPVALTATASAGYFFAGWSGDCSGFGASTTVIVNGPRVCAAHFEPFVSPAPRSLYSWTSQVGDYIGDGTSGSLSPLNSRWTVSSADNGRAVMVGIEGVTRSWRIELSAPIGQPLTPGYYGAARRFPFTPFNGLSVSSDSSGCNDLTGRFVVLEVAIAGDGTVERFAADFEQHCGDAAPGVFGAIRYHAAVHSVQPFNSTFPAYEVSVPPPVSGGRVTAAGLDCGGAAAQCHVSLAGAGNLALTATPDFGYMFTGWTEDCSGGAMTTLHVNSVKRCGARFEPVTQTAPRTLLRWESDPNHYIGQGRSEVWSPANSLWTVQPYGGASGVQVKVLSVGPRSESSWTLNFRAPLGEPLMPGAYLAVAYAGGDDEPTFDISGNGRGCNGGQFTVREIVYGPENAVLSFSVDFVLNCGMPSGPLLTGTLQYNSVINLPSTAITLDPGLLRFAALHNGSAVTTQPAPQTARVTLSRPNVGWAATANQPWIQVTPAFGTGSAVVTIAPNLLGGHPGNGSAAGAVTFTLTDGSNTSQSLPVAVSLHSIGATSAPFGIVDTPLDHRTGVTGAIPMTGWALDDIGVESLTICRNAVAGEAPPNDPNCGGSAQIYVGHAVFIEGSRPDVQTAFPGYPRSQSGGWGFMILTNMLPAQGNGNFVFTSYARDHEGNVTALGTRTMTCDNANASFPFGTIDTPGQGETIGGSSYPSFGWVLTQQPKHIPFDGSTISVYVDGNLMGTASYNHPRADIAALFPGFANSNGAIGFRIIDTTALSNGLHTIVWNATDSDGKTSGLGSRFFRVANGISGSATANAGTEPLTASAESAASLPVERTALAVRRGWDPDAPWRDHAVGSSGPAVVRGEELDRFELLLDASSGDRYSGYHLVGGRLTPLPAGSHLDADGGRFTWSPGAGFIGTYDLLFIRGRGGRPTSRRDIRIIIHPKGSGHLGMQVAIDAPRTLQTVSQPFALGGWAADLDAAEGTGIDTLHVWAYPLSGGPPVFLGAAIYGGARPDVAAVHGDRFGAAGFGLSVAGLPAGDYDLAVFPWSRVSSEFAPAQLVRISVR